MKRVALAASILLLAGVTVAMTVPRTPDDATMVHSDGPYITATGVKARLCIVHQTDDPSLDLYFVYTEQDGIPGLSKGDQVWWSGKYYCTYSGPGGL